MTDKRNQLSDELFETVLSALPGLVSYMNPELRYLYVNDAYQKWFGVSRDKCLSSTMHDIIGDAGIRSVKPYLEAAFAGVPQDFESEVPYKYGGLRNIHVRYIPDKAKDATVRGLIVIVQDVTKEKTAIAEKLDSEKRLADDRARLYALFTQSADPIMTLAPPSWRFTGCNPAAVQLFGLRGSEEIEKLGPWDLSPEKQPDGELSANKAQKAISKAMQQGSHFFDWTHKTIQGKEIDCTVLLSRIEVQGQSYLQATVRDVSEQRARELETHMILETMADGLVIQNNTGMIEKSNPAALTHLGLTEDQLVGRSSLDPRWKAIREDGSDFPGEEHPAMVALKTGNPVKDVIMGLNLPDGKSNWIKINAVPYESSSGRRVACTFSDVTDLLNAQREIRFVLDALKIGIWKFNPSTQELFWDKSMYDVFDLKESDFSGHYQAWESTLTPESKAQAVEDLAQALRGEKEFNTVFEIETRSRGKRFISGQGTVIRNKDNQPVMMFGINSDVTDQIKMKKELELERTKALRNAKLASLGEMSAGIAHEINNPLAIISLAVGVLPKFADNPEKLSEKIQSIKKSCERISKIIAGLRKFSRTAEKSDFKPYKLSAILNEAITLTDANAKRHSTTVRVNCPTDLEILCDEIEIEQVMVNLINNAIDAVKESSTKWVEILARRENQNITLRITDSGPGIPETIRGKIFDPFFTTKKTGEGTGLGLSITKGILDEHHANISVLPDSPNTCFEIQFPLKKSS